MLMRKPLLYDKKKNEFDEGYYFTLIEVLLEDDPTRAGFEENGEDILTKGNETPSIVKTKKNEKEGTQEIIHAFGEEAAP